ncbi:FAD dependent oxidoreductase [Schizophyllum amplum]|uniref:FAD dependent oxidoreductase n=1 Tax=Schizophyllum amplum TaxID=97359 RepID=A0A550C6B2_9AGAR|nr:FAD dependent oxidoreductase [Auriculariopsis ampla]
MAAPQTQKIVVLGAGVVGLTTALKLQEKGDYAVTIVAELFPNDPLSIKYTSNWAGAHHVSLAGDDVRQQNMDRETFDEMWKLSAPGGAAEGCFLRIPQTEMYHQQPREPHELSWMPNFQTLSKESLVGGTIAGITFDTITIDTPKYLAYLMARFCAAGGAVVRASVGHINEVIEGGAGIYGPSRKATPPDAVIVCVGLGARALGGVNDSAMFPIRGQTLLVRAPWVRFGRTISSKDGLWTYIIPRRGGDVIVGGTKLVDDWYPLPRPETTEDILRRGLALCPELVPPEVRAEREGTVDDVRALIVMEGCGLRPARAGGIRLEVDWVAAKADATKTPVVFNYGHAGYGFQSSWGSASIAVGLLEKALQEGPGAHVATASTSQGADDKKNLAAHSW